MFSLPRPRSSNLTTRAPVLVTLELTAWNFGAAASAGATASAETAAASTTEAARRRMPLPLHLWQPCLLVGRALLRAPRLNLTECLHRTQARRRATEPPRGPRAVRARPRGTRAACGG